MSCAPLHLTLESLPAQRTPNDDGSFEYGVYLRIVSGAVLTGDDPLLAAYGARIDRLFALDRAAAQGDEFAPGRHVTLEIEFDDDGDSILGVWDASGLRRAGAFGYRRHCPTIAAIDHGLELRGLIVRDLVQASTNQRIAIDLLIYSPCFVEVDIPTDLVIERPERAAPQRVVLIADGAGEVSFWDPSVEAGPASPNDLPLSPELAAELARLRERYLELAADDGDDDEMIIGDWMRESLDQRAAILWRRARVELGRRFAVGFQGPGMSSPVWSPREMAKDDDEEDFFGD